MVPKGLHSKPKRLGVKWLAAAVSLAMVAVACSGDDTSTDPEPDSTTTTSISAPDATTTTTEPPDQATTTTTTTTTTTVPTITEDRAYYILPPGNYGGIPTTDNSFDQLPLYDGLTPLRGNINDADIDSLFLPQNFEPVGETVEEPTGREGTTILYDEFGIAHVSGVTREDLAFGAGWVTARDRDLLLTLGRGPARVAVADVPGINAFSLITSAQSFTPSAAAEQLVTDQVNLIVETYGSEGEQIISDAAAYAEGINAFWEANGIVREPANVNDVIAVTAFIGSIFGAGGGSEVDNAEFLSGLKNALGAQQGTAAWEDFMQTDDPEAPTTIDQRFEYGTFTGGEVTGSVVIDEGSVISLDPRTPVEGSGPVFSDERVLYEAASAPPSLTASNWLTVAPERSVNNTTLAVMGPQLGYYYPEIVQQIHLSGPGIEAQGIAVPGLAMYILIGRTTDYAWSLTSANQDVIDVYAEVLCNPDGSTPSRESSSYMFEGECIPFEQFYAGMLGDTPIRYPVSVHGPVIGTAMSQGKPVALTRKRSTFGRDGLNLAALKDMTEGDAATPDAFFEVTNQFGFTFNWGYANRQGIAYFASGHLPERAEGLDRRLPTLGTGEYEWQGFLEQDEHPHASGHPSGRLLNWNNQSAPGFMHGDGNLYGSVHRVELFDQWPDKAELKDVVGIMNRSATEDTLSPVWPVISEVLRSTDAPSSAAAEVVDLLDAWVDDDAPLLDADEDGFYDRAGAFLFDRLWGPITDTVMEPVFGEIQPNTINFRGIGTASLIDKDLRTLLGHQVEGPFNLRYCGAGDLEECSDSLWATIESVVSEITAERGDDPSMWLREGLRSSFAPNLIPNTFRSTNRPTFQQLLEFAPTK